LRKKIAFFSTSRADYSLISPLIKSLKKDKTIESKLIICGSHLSKKHGYTVKEILQDRNKVNFKFKSYQEKKTNISHSIELIIKGFNKALSKLKPDLIFLPADRYEILGAAYAAYIKKIPIAHYAGGQITEGAWDDSIRHAVTKLSNYHFVSTKNCKRNLLQLGENPKSIFITGSLGIDNIKNLSLYTIDQIEKKTKFKFQQRFALVTYHFETMSKTKNSDQISNLIKVLKKFNNISFIFTAPNIDRKSIKMIEEIKDFVRSNKKSVFIPSLGKELYLSILKKSKFVIGNSSSGIIEAPSFRVPTINIGDRQKGRVMCSSIINCQNNEKEIFASIKKALNKKFIFKIRKVKSPYGSGRSAQKIVKILKKINLKNIGRKKFFLNKNV
jgi:GDP/UDP-N,N'-diacetylbacillosamine 2-epimerase (hydrolysing)